MLHTSTATRYQCASAHSTHVEPTLAAEELAHKLKQQMTEADLLLVFASGSHARALSEISCELSETIDTAVMLCVSGEGVIAGDTEFERTGALSALALSMPGTTLHPFRDRDLHADTALGEIEAARKAIRASEDLRALILFADPFSVPGTGLLQTLSEAVKPCAGPADARCIPVIGGLASASTVPGGNVLVLNGEIMRAGAVGVSISGDVRIDTIVSQGCRPIGDCHIITKGERNLIRELGGRPAMKVLHDTIQNASDNARLLLENGVHIGRVVNEFRDRFGRGDFLIRGIMGIDPETNSIAIGDSIRVGQTVQFHVQDAQTASQDLALLLDAEQVKDPALGVLAVSCTGRGSRLFELPNQDTTALNTRLSDPDSGTRVPMSGFFSAGEFGPIAGNNFVHGHTLRHRLPHPRPPLIPAHPPDPGDIPTRRMSPGCVRRIKPAVFSSVA